MATNFDWNQIPGVQNTEGSVSATAAPTDHFDEFFNSQLGQAQQSRIVSPISSDPSASHLTKLQLQSQPQSSQQQQQQQQPQQQQQQQGNSQFFSSHPAITKSQASSNDHSQLADATRTDRSLSNVFNKLNISSTRSHSDDTIDTIKPSLAKTLSDTSSPLKKIMENPTHSSSTDTIIADNDSSIPLSLALNDMSQKELKTYLRWYENIQERKITNKTVTLNDVFIFMQNFKIPQQIKERMKLVFTKWSNSLNIGQFFALMRLLAHALLGEPLARSLIKIPAPVPRPISILSRKRKERSESTHENLDSSSIDEPKKKLDIDSFTEFILTGERPSSKQSSNTKSHKKVKFSEVVSFSPPPPTVEDGNQPQVENPRVMSLPQQHILDFSLPMDQLLDKLKAESTGTPETVNQPQIQPQLQQQPINPQPTENEEEELKDVQIDTFKNITQKASQNTGDQPLKPNLTGSASKSMKEHFLQQFEQTFNFNSGSFNSTYPSINALSAVPVASPGMDQLPLLSPTKETPQSVQSAFGSSQLQAQTPLQMQLTQNQEPTQVKVQSPDRQQTDYFGMTSQNGNSVSSPLISNLTSGMNASNILQPPLPPPSRSRAGSSASPPPVPPPPPPPRSRKNSRAPSGSSNAHSNPILPPKPVLNEHQKQQYLSVSDGDNLMQINPLNGMHNLNANGLATVNTGYPSSYNLNGLNNLSQVNQLNQITQMHQMGSMNNLSSLNNMNGLSSPNLNKLNAPNVQNYNRPPALVYGQQGNLAQSPQFQNPGMFMTQNTGGGWPSLHQQQQPQQQPSSQLQPQQTSPHPQQQQQQQQQNSWAGWQY